MTWTGDFEAEAIDDISSVQSGSFARIWDGLCFSFAGQSYAWRKEFCLKLIERLLREDRCRLWSVSNYFGKLPADADDNWNEPIEEVMRKLRESWTHYEGKPVDRFNPEGFDDGYFIDAIPPVVWPPYSSSR